MGVEKASLLVDVFNKLRAIRSLNLPTYERSNGFLPAINNINTINSWKQIFKSFNDLSNFDDEYDEISKLFGHVHCWDRYSQVLFFVWKGQLWVKLACLCIGLRFLQVSVFDVLLLSWREDLDVCAFYSPFFSFWCPLLLVILSFSSMCACHV